MRRLLRVVVLLVAGVGLTGMAQLIGVPPAVASCVSPPRVSAHPFTGTVTSVTNMGRNATVRTDDSRTVTISGSPASNPNSVTTVDRKYQVGVHYEFHPINDTDPYQDNDCTATHPIAAASPTEPGTAPASSGPATSSGVTYGLPLIACGVGLG